MSATAQELSARLQRLHANGHPVGLPSSKAEAFVRDLSAGAPLEQAAERVGLDPRLARSVTIAGVTQLPTVLDGLLGTAAASLTHARALRTAATYPLVLALSIAVTGAVVFGTVGPALSMLPLGAPTATSTPLLVALVITIGLLAALSLVVLSRVPIPQFSHGWQRIEGLAFLECLQVLDEAGATLPRALRAASCWCSGSATRRSEALARAMEAGGTPPGLAPLFDPFEVSLLMSAASTGALPEALSALVTHRRLALERELPAQIMRIHAAAMALSGLSLVVVAGAFFYTYYGSLAG